MDVGETESWVIGPEALNTLITALRERGYSVYGPVVRDHAILYDEIRELRDLPVGYTDIQSPGRYRLTQREDSAVFGYVVGPHSWKRLLFPPVQRLIRITRDGQSIHAETAEPSRERYAFFGVRPCEIAAMAVQDKVFLGGEFIDPHYKARRDDVFVVAVNCGSPADTCFCASLGTGPMSESGFDLALTELIDDGEHEFVVDVGSARGQALIADIERRPAEASDLQRRRAVIVHAIGRMTRRLPANGVKTLLQRNPEHPRWAETAERCLSCANCTMVCPTCFCSTVEDTTDLNGATAERIRKWDSCFTMDFSYIVGGSTRPSVRARYRHWLTHKLANWEDQFGVLGCTGCGRCITWCPVGIDLTEEVAAIGAVAPPQAAEEM